MPAEATESPPPAPAPVDVPVPEGYAAGAPVPWWLKLGVKLVLGALPVPAEAWRRLGLRRHSFDALDPGRLVDPLAWRIRRFTELAGRAPRAVLEVGPGAMVLRAPIAAALGLGPIWYLDVEDAAPRELAPYRAAAEAARRAGLQPPDLAACHDREAVLAACGARLLVGGPERLAAVPAASVDLVFSEVALEHVRRDALAPLLAGLRRVAAPGGLGLHAVDFHDHLGGKLRHLAFGPGFWEGPAVARAGLYCNQLGLSEMLAAFAAAGFTAQAAQRLVWPLPQLPPGGVHPALGRAPEDDRVCHAAIEARPA
ncbi:methyltransferase domain-containing protein [Falsiroseomonas selenitidurans]|uniref:Class I SAM-dependent methyltransferase n=1 Tax=Falsiroseomonas selenitidurans TaxID=2716335 RepID=A0ABX1E1U7_9PROT|nr:class I SAM-dependent methyltransferase [Falsiroseomonas selenitidurans]NKC31011.1 class I SAM-dependent methyltransferase [Falsiroseomonas selenitidurans]